MAFSGAQPTKLNPIDDFVAGMPQGRIAIFQNGYWYTTIQGDQVKLSAAWLIEHSGFHKGWTFGNIGLSSKHTLAIVNRGGGTAREVVELVRLIQSKVRENFGVELQPEPNFIGFRS